MENFTVVDGGAALIILLSAILAYSRGLVRELMSIVGWIGAAILAFIFAPSATRKLAVSTISGSRAAFSMMVVPSDSVAADMMVTVAPTLTLSMTMCAPFRRPLTEALT